MNREENKTMNFIDAFTELIINKNKISRCHDRYIYISDENINDRKFIIHNIYTNLDSIYKFTNEDINSTDWYIFTVADKIQEGSYKSKMCCLEAIEQALSHGVKIARDDWKDLAFTQYIKVYETEDGCIEFRYYNSGIGHNLEYSFHCADYNHDWYIFDDNQMQEESNNYPGSIGYQRAMKWATDGYFVSRMSWGNNKCLKLCHDVSRDEFFFEMLDADRSIKYVYHISCEDRDSSDWYRIMKDDDNKKFSKVGK